MNSDLILLETDVRDLRSEVNWIKDRLRDIELKAARDRAQLLTLINELQTAVAGLGK